MSDISKPTLTAVQADPPLAAIRGDDLTPSLTVALTQYTVQIQPNPAASVTVDTAVVFGYPPLQVATYTTNRTLAPDDDIADFDTTSGPLVCTLPSAGGATKLWFTIANIGTSTLTITPNGIETIEGAATFVLLPGEVVDVYADATGTNWRIK
jgi:hypothetical protein